MFHVPAHKNLVAPAGQVIPKVWVVCDSCGGAGDHGYDEDGRIYSCYACGESGGHLLSGIVAAVVSQERDIQEVKAEIEKARFELELKKLKAELGIPESWNVRYDEYSGEHYGVPPLGAKPARVEDFDDVPF